MRPIPHSHRSPIRRIVGAESGPPMSAPTPWTAMSTPIKLGLRCSSLLVIAKIAVSINPTTLSATASEIAMRRRIGVRATWWKPAEISARKCSGVRSGFSSRTCSARTENPAITNVAESNAAIQCPPTMTKRPAPTSGATRRRPSRTVRRKPLASPSCSVGNNTVKNAD